MLKRSLSRAFWPLVNPPPEPQVRMVPVEKFNQEQEKFQLEQERRVVESPQEMLERLAPGFDLKRLVL